MNCRYCNNPLDEDGDCTAECDHSRERQCPCIGEHRPLGGRAWCHDCSEYCRPNSHCVRGEAVALGPVAEALDSVDPEQVKLAYDQIKVQMPLEFRELAKFVGLSFGWDRDFWITP